MPAPAAETADETAAQGRSLHGHRPAACIASRGMAQDKPLLGILLMLGFCIVAPLGDATAKLLGDSLPLLQLIVVRFLLQAAMLFPVTLIGGRAWRMHGRVLWLTVARTVLHILGITMMFSALRYLELADAVAIAFVMPFIMLLLGRFVLGEEVGYRRLAACAIGFVGTLMVIQPSFAEVGLPALLPLGVALSFSLFMMVTRQIAKEVDPIGMQAVSGLMATAVLVPLAAILWLLDAPGSSFVRPQGADWMLLLLIGVIGSFGHLLMTWSLRYAPAATLAPMQYLEIPFATLIGWLIFHDLPDGLAGLGILVTVGAGLYVVLRERALARAAPGTVEPLPPVPPAA